MLAALLLLTCLDVVTWLADGLSVGFIVGSAFCPRDDVVGDVSDGEAACVLELAAVVVASEYAVAHPGGE